MPQEIRILPIRELKGNDVSRHNPYAYTKYPVCGFDPELGDAVPQCQISVYDIPPLCSNYPYHYHENSTEIFYILEGRGVLETSTGNHPVTAGDFIVMPPGEKGAHLLRNASFSVTLRYLDFDTVSRTDEVYYPRSAKKGIIYRDGRLNEFLRDGKPVDYYDGE